MDDLITRHQKALDALAAAEEELTYACAYVGDPDVIETRQRQVEDAQRVVDTLNDEML